MFQNQTVQIERPAVVKAGSLVLVSLLPIRRSGHQHHSIRHLHVRLSFLPAARAKKGHVEIDRPAQRDDLIEALGEDIDPSPVKSSQIRAIREDLANGIAGQFECKRPPRHRDLWKKDAQASPPVGDETVHYTKQPRAVKLRLPLHFAPSILLAMPSEEKNDSPESAGFVTVPEKALLEEIKAGIAEADTLADILRFLFAKARELLPFDRLSVAFVEENGRRLRSTFTLADYQSLLLGTGYQEELAGKSLEQVLVRGEPRLIDNLEEHLHAHPQSVSTQLLVGEGIRSSMTCPLRVDERIVGALFYSARRPGAFTSRHVGLHQSIIDRMSRAIDKAYRFEQLQAANNAYLEMLGFVTHELKSPISSILSLTRLLTGGYQGPVTDQQRETLERIVKQGEYLLGLIGEYLTLANLEAGELRPNLRFTTDVVLEVIEPAVELMEPRFATQRQELRRDFPAAPISLALDPEQVKIVLLNLLGNAAKYGRTGGAVQVFVAAEGDWLRVAVRNEGPGFPPAAKSKLFRKFSRLDEPELKKKPGTGIGLYTSWRIIQAHGGKLTADSEPGRWAEFVFRLPLKQPM